MLNIIDNVRLPSLNQGALPLGFDPWLEKILRRMASTETDDDFVVRLDSDRRAKTIVYRLENSQNKTCASISKRLNRVMVELTKRLLPDPENGIKPPMALESAFVFEKTDEGLAKAAAALAKVIGARTPYSERTVTKIKVYPNAPASDPWSFSGGLITSIVSDWKADTWVINVGATVFTIPKKTFGRQSPKVLQYLVTDGNRAELVMETEFDHYFELMS